MPFSSFSTRIVNIRAGDLRQTGRVKQVSSEVPPEARAI